MIKLSILSYHGTVSMLRMAKNEQQRFTDLAVSQLYSSYILTTNKLELKGPLCTPWIDAITITIKNRKMIFFNSSPVKTL